MCSSCSQCFLCGCERVKCVVLCLYRAGVGGDIPAGRVREMCSSCSQCFLCGCEGVKRVVLCLYRAGVGGGDIPAGRVV